MSFCLHCDTDLVGPNGCDCKNSVDKENIELIFEKYKFLNHLHDNKDLYAIFRKNGIPINDNGILDYGFLSRQDNHECVIFIWKPTKE